MANRYLNPVFTLIKMRKQTKRWFWSLFLSFLLVTLGTTLVHSGQVKNKQSGIELIALSYEESNRIHILKPGDESGYVLHLQKELRDLGFYLSPTTGYYDETTTKAVRAFKQQQKLPPTDVADEKTLDALKNIFDTHKSTFKLGDKGFRVIELQRDRKSVV